PSGLKKLVVKGKSGKTKLNISVPQLLTGSACGALVSVPIAIPLKANGDPKKPFYGKASISSTGAAVSGTKPGKGQDTREVRALVGTVACSTTTTSTSTTTTTLGPCTNPSVTKLHFTQQAGTTSCGGPALNRHCNLQDGSANDGQPCTPATEATDC